MIKLVDRHILAEIVPSFIMGVALFAGFIVIAGGPLLNAFGYMARGFPLRLVLQLIALYLPPNILLAFPIAILIAVIFGFTRLSGESEAVAIFASGTSFYRLLVPVGFFGLSVTLLGLIINNSVVPAANARINDLKTNIFKDGPRSTEPFSLPLRQGKSHKLLALVWVEGGFDSASESMKNVTIIVFDPGSTRPTMTISADSAKWDGLAHWSLQNVVTQRGGLTTITPKMTDLSYITLDPSSVKQLTDSPDNYTFLQLAHHIQQLRKSGAKYDSALRQAEVNLWEKISLPCACFVFALVGAPLGLKVQRAASRIESGAYGVLIVLGYYAFYKFLDLVGTSGAIDPIVAAFLPNFVGLLLGGYLISRATT